MNQIIQPKSQNNRYLHQIQRINHPDYQPIDNIYLFSNSKYTVHILNNNIDTSIYSINSQQPISTFIGFQIPDKNNIKFCVVLSTLGSMQGSKWILYMIHIKDDKYQIMRQIQGRNTVFSKLINIHVVLCNSDRFKLLWIFENGRLEYCDINTNNKNRICTKPFQPAQKQQEKLKYSGPKLLKQITNQNAVIVSAFNQLNNILAIAIINNNSQNTSCIYQFILNIQQYHILAGQNNLVSVSSIPTKIDFIYYKNQQILLLVFKDQIATWSSQGLNAYSEQIQQSLIRLDNNNYIYIKSHSNTLIHLCVQHDYQISSNELPNQYSDQHHIAYLKQNITSKKYYIINNKLQLLKFQANLGIKKLISNSYTNIRQAQVIFKDFYNYILFTKRIGFSYQEYILTNNQIVTHKSQYMHNMLIKMSQTLCIIPGNQFSKVWLTSPILGLFQLDVSIDKQGNFELNTIKSRDNFIIQEQTLYFSPFQGQISATQISIKDKKYQIQKIFQGKIDYIIGGCLCGSFILLAIQRQIHAFIIQGNTFKRVGINVFDSEIKKVININNVNIVGIILWDMSFILLSISQTTITPIKTSETIDWQIQPNISYVHSSEITINTQKFICTILSGYMILCSSDALHIYQPQKTIIETISLPKNIFGTKIYPIIDINNSTDYTFALVYIQSKDEQQKVYRVLRIGKKSLVKDYKQIKLQIEEIIAFPQVDDPLFMAIHNNSYMIVCSNKVVTFQTATNKIPLQQTIYLNKWINKLKNPQITMEIKTDNQTQQIIFDNVQKLTNNRFIVWNTEQIWLSCQNTIKQCANKNIHCHPISYFSMPNDSFLEFRNNLSIDELEDPDFMKIFAKKQNIKSVTKINTHMFAVLYNDSIIIVQIGLNQMLVIKQQLLFKKQAQQVPEQIKFIKITQFMGYYDSMSLYLKDSINHRLYVLKYHQKQNLYKIQYIQNLEVDDQFVCINRICSWKQGRRKIDLQKYNPEGRIYQELIIKTDGHMTVGKDKKTQYL